MEKLRNLCLEVFVNEGIDIPKISANDVEKIIDVNFDSNDVRIEFQTPYNKKMFIVTSFEDFSNWAYKNKGSKNKFKHFISDFLQNSKELDGDLNEIIDDGGEIIGDDDMPVNSNAIVKSPKYDLEKIYKSFVPKSIRHFSGSMGLGTIVW